MKDLYNNYQNRFISLANLTVSNLPKSLEFNGNKFIVKPEFHITLLASGQIAEIIDSKNIENLKLEIVEDFYNFVEQNTLTKYELTGELRFVEVEEKKTIVAMARVENIDKLFSQLSEKYKKELPVQPTHITLYTLPTDDFGIPILSYEELNKISEVVEIPGIKNALF